MVAPPIPHYETPRPVDPLGAMTDSLRATGWAPLVELLDPLREGEGVHVFAARPAENSNIPLEVVQKRLGYLIQNLPPDDQLTISMGEPDSTFAGRTFVDYRGSNEDYTRRLIGSLTSLGAEAHSTTISHLRMMETWGTTGGLAIVGLGYALLHLHRR